MPRPSGRGRVLRVRTIKPKPGTYIHVDVMSKKGPRGGRTVAGKVHHVKSRKKHYK